MSKSTDNRLMVNNLLQANSLEESNIQPINLQFAVSKLITTSTFYRDKKSVLKSSKGFEQDQPLSINSGVKYEPYEFEKNIRKNYGSKLEEELYKIKQYTSEMVRNEQEAKVKDKNHQKIRQQEMQNYEKKIPKLAILHKIQAYHRRKFPQFDINKCLNKKKQYPEDVSREEIIVFEEKKIAQSVARKSLLQRQQDIIKRCLSPDTRDKLGIQLETNHNTQNNLGDETNKTQQQISEVPFGFGTRTPSNRHQTPCCFSFHDENIQKQLLNRSFNNKRASTSSEYRRYNQLNQSLDTHIQSYGNNFSDKQNLKIFAKRSSLIQTANNINQGNQTDTAYSSIQQQNNPYDSTLQSTVQQHYTQRKVSTANSTLQQDSPEKERQAFELQKKKRENSPMRFLFKKYENVINESYDDFRIEMKSVADIYISGQKKRRDSTAQQDTVSQQNQNTESSQNKRRKESENQINKDISVNLQKQQNLQQNANQRKNSLSIYQTTQQKMRQNFQSLNTSQNTSPQRQQQPQEYTEGYNIPNQNTRKQQQPHPSSAVSTQRQSQGQSRFLEQNDGIYSKNQQLNKTLYEFEKESKQIKKAAKNIQQFAIQSEKQMDSALEMRKKGDSYNVSDFLMKVQFKKMHQQEEQQKQESLNRKFGKVQRNTTNNNRGDLQN